MTISTPYPSIAVPGEWRPRALCAGDASPDDWFADPKTTRGQRAARICASCPVREGCTAHARDVGEEFGRWGDQLGQTLRAPAACGTRAGYDSHRRAGEPPCKPCTTANAAYMADRRSRLALVPVA